MSVRRKSDRCRRDARLLRDRLIAEGREFDANVLQMLIRSSESSTETNLRLYRENKSLREQLRER